MEQADSVLYRIDSAGIKQFLKNSKSEFVFNNKTINWQSTKCPCFPIIVEINITLVIKHTAILLFFSVICAGVSVNSDQKLN